MNQLELDARRELAACYRIVDYYGWTSIVYNHISLRLPGTDHYLINPFGLRYDQVTPENLIKIDLDGNKISKSEWPVNRAGFVIHSAVHKARPDLHCIIHTHEAWSQSLSASQTKFVPVTQEGCQFYERVGYLPFKQPRQRSFSGSLIDLTKPFTSLYIKESAPMSFAILFRTFSDVFSGSSCFSYLGSKSSPTVDISIP